VFLFCVGTTRGPAPPYLISFGGVDERGQWAQRIESEEKLVFAGKMRSDSKRALKRQKNGEETAGDDICHPGSSCMRCSCMILALLLFFRILVRVRPFLLSD